MSILNNNISVSIDGKRLFSFKSLNLHQSINDHHRFELILDIETGGNRYAHNLKDSAKWIGKSFAVYAGEKSETTFLGVITGVSLHRKNSDFGHILVSGYSETYLLETDLNFHSWNDFTLADIIKEITANAGVSAKINPEYTEKLDYVCQYNESDFTFIKRLALQYNEWLYYDGIDLIFGRPAHLPNAVKLEFGTSLSSLDIGVKALARPAKVFSYHSLNDQIIAAETPNTPTDKDGLGYDAFMASMAMYKTPARQYALPRIHYSSEMTRYVRKKQEGDTAESHYVLGKSEKATLVTGSVVDLKSSFLERVGNMTDESLGEFLITEITHTVGENSYYSNTFKAIPAVVETLPNPDVELPVAEPQMAKVTKNDDKFGHGRVKVQMNWQTGNMSTNWIRVMTPDGGSSNEVRTNRGFVFIPEVGDHVLVGFRHGDPNRPYVMGSLFNGTTGAGGSKDNKIKSITTRSGCSLLLNDAKGSVTLHDKGGVNMNFDGGGNLSTTSKISHTVNSGEIAKINVGGKKDSPPMSALTMDNQGVIDLTGQKSITLKVGDSSLIMSADGNITISCKRYKIDAEVNTQINVGESYLRLYPTLAFLHSKTMTQLNSENIVNLHSGKVIHINGQNFVNIKGTLIKLNS